MAPFFLANHGYGLTDFRGKNNARGGEGGDDSENGACLDAISVRNRDSSDGAGLSIISYQKS